MEEYFDRAPEDALVVVLTITEVTGRPPTRPHKVLATPCAFNSRFNGVIRLYGSILSAASILNKVSILATRATVAAILYTAGLRAACQSGKLKEVTRDER